MDLVNKPIAGTLPPNFEISTHSMMGVVDKFGTQVVCLELLASTAQAYPEEKL